MMSSSEKRRVFLEYLKKLYEQNPSFEFTFDTIYNELRLFNGNEKERIREDSLLNVQCQLSRRFSGTKGHLFSNGYFLVFENRGNNDMGDFSFYYLASNSIKLYIACDITNIYNMASSLFDFILKEGIISQSKIAKEARNDALVVRVDSPESAKKVANYVNSLGYSSKISPNPFILEDGNVSMTWDGSLSYNKMLSLFLKYYFDMKRKENALDSVSEKDLAKFIKRELFMCGDVKRYLSDRYGRIRKEKDFVKIANIIMDNLNGVMTKDKLFEYQRDIEKDSSSRYDRDDDRKDKILHFIHILSNYYDTSYFHAMITRYVKDGNVNVFTRKGFIRDFVISYDFSPDEMKDYIIDIGVKSFTECILLTLEKYNRKQCIFAIVKVILKGEVDGFTRDYEVRNKLGLVVPKEWFSLIIESSIGVECSKQLEMISGLSKERIDMMIDGIRKAVLNGDESMIERDELTREVLSLANSVYDNSIMKIEEERNKKAGRK